MRKSFSANDAGAVGQPQEKNKNPKTTENFNLNITHIIPKKKKKNSKQVAYWNVKL